MIVSYLIKHDLPRSLVLGVLLATGLGAQTSPVVLDTVVSSATRTSEAIPTLGTAVDVVSGADFLEQQRQSLADALGAVAGVPSFASGQRGSSVSVFMRGANSNQVLFLVDGIRLNDPNTDYGPLIGGMRMGAYDTLEVARGPQSTLYGGEAIGGVVALGQAKGSGTPSSVAGVEAGSFGTFQGDLQGQGAEGPWAYSFSAAGGKTENERPNNAFENASIASRLDRVLTPELSVGATLRGFVGKYGDPGDEYTNDPDNYDEERNWLGTVFADVSLAQDWSGHLTLGGQDRLFTSVNPTVGSATQITRVANHRGVIDAQTTVSNLARQQVTLGVTAEAETTNNDGFGSIDRRQGVYALFAQDEWHPLDRLYLTAGARRDDFDTFGSALTGRLTTAWLATDALKLRASMGTGFRAPSFLDLYGQSAFYVGNPRLSAERSRGWDSGLDYYLPDSRGSLSVSWFRTDFTDLIEDDFSVFPATTLNVSRARTSGVEVSAHLTLPGQLGIRGSYTYLEAADLSAGERLLRRPRNSGSLDLSRKFGSGFSLGIGIQVVRDRMDINALTYATVEDPDYSVLRGYGTYRLSDRVTLTARVENALDRRYEPVNGFPALGRGVYAGVRWTL